MIAKPKPPDPEPYGTPRPGARGTVVEVMGRAWLFADYVPALEPVWDRLFDDNNLRGEYDQTAVRQAALRLLEANYDLSADDACAIVRAADIGDLVTAVEAALFGPDRVHNTYCHWVKVTLWANGLDPDRVPAADRRDVLDYLVQIGRAAPASEYISSVEAARFRAGLAALAARRNGTPAPENGDG